MGHQRFKKFWIPVLICWWIIVMNFLDDFSGFFSSSECKSSSIWDQTLSKQIIFLRQKSEQLVWREKLPLKAEPLIFWSTTKNALRSSRRKISYATLKFIAEGEGDWFLQGLDSFGSTHVRSLLKGPVAQSSCWLAKEDLKLLQNLKFWNAFEKIRDNMKDFNVWWRKIPENCGKTRCDIFHHGRLVFEWKVNLLKKMKRCLL